jgi:signal transduction histidine kinase
MALRLAVSPIFIPSVKCLVKWPHKFYPELLPPLNDNQAQYTRLAKSSAHALLTVVNDILDFSKIEADKLDLEMIDFDLEALCGDFAETVSVHLRKQTAALPENTAERGWDWPLLVNCVS